MPYSSIGRTRQSAVLAAIVAVAFALGCGSDNDAPTTPRVVTKTVAITGGQGSGRVTSSEGKLDCRLTNGAPSGPRCSAAFDSGSVAALTAVPDAGQEFVAWSGDCAGATCQLNVTRDVTASPRFVVTQGALTIDLTTPNADDGAILFTVTGPSVLGVTPGPAVEMMETRATANGVTTSTILLRGNLSTGAVGQLSVRGLDLDGTYSVQLLQAAARASGGYAQRGDLAAYRVTIHR